MTFPGIWWWEVLEYELFNKLERSQYLLESFRKRGITLLSKGKEKVKKKQM